MEIFTSYNNTPTPFQNAIIAIGNFDGIHRGHQALIKKTKALAKEKNTKACILTFEPHPRALFQPDNPPSRITPHDLKMHRLEQEGIDATFVLPFDWEFASQSAQDFIQNILKDGLKAGHIIVGHDFCFGQLRKGTPQTIKDSDLNTTIIEKIEDKTAQAFSSSRIRQAIRHGDIKTANEILGWDWEITGTVVKGDQRGRELGYPTANFDLEDTIHPAYGIYATLARIEGENAWHHAATNIGIRPMFEVPTAQVETFIFDFDREIYGQTLHIRPIKRLRGEAKFDSLEELITQMDKDCEKAREILKEYK